MADEREKGTAPNHLSFRAPLFFLSLSPSPSAAAATVYRFFRLQQQHRLPSSSSSPIPSCFRHLRSPCCFSSLIKPLRKLFFFFVFFFSLSASSLSESLTISDYTLYGMAPTRSNRIRGEKNYDLIYSFILVVFFTMATGINP